MSGPSRAWALVLATLLLSPVAAVQSPATDADLDLPVPEATAAPAAAEAAWTLPDRLVVGYEATDAPAVLARLASAMGGRLVRVDETLRFVVLQVEPARAQDLAKAALRVPGVAYAKPDARIEASFTPNDPRYAEQWGPAPLGMPAAWDVTRGNHTRVVAILDTGVDGTHPDLAPNFCVDGPDYANGDASSMDDHGHGTHVAGTVAAAIDNGVGVAGMADACLMAVKVLDDWGSGSFADLASALAWAADHGAHVVSMSLGGCPGCDPSSPTTEAIRYAHDAGVLLVAAAGNAWCSPVSYPAAYPEVVAVAALAPPGDAAADFSSCGEQVEVAAPGEDVLSTALTAGPLSDPSGYMTLSGTSMATPHVSGVAALAWAHDPTLTNEDLRCVLAQTSVDLGDAGRDAATGFGRVDAAAALGAACVPAPPTAVTLAARARDARVQLRWTGATSHGVPLEGYNVYRAEGNGSLVLLASLGDVQEFEDVNVTNGVGYTYVVAGVNAVGEGEPSNAVAATPNPTPPFSCAASTDAFGNACSTIPLGFVDVRDTGDEVAGADDALVPLALPFPFRFYGRDYDRVNVSTNGFLTFFEGVDDGCCWPQRIPSEPTPNAFVAALWADLLPTHARAITTQTLGEPGSRVHVVQFTDVPFYPGLGDARVTFQFQLHEATGAAEVHYLDADPLDESAYTAGIEACNGEDGIEAVHGTAPLVGTAVRYSPGNGAPPACRENAPPVTVILAPGDGEGVRGVVAVNGTAADPDAGDEVEWVGAYYHNDSTGFALSVRGTTAWSASLDASGLSGWYTLVAYAFDGAAYGPDARVRFFVGDPNATTPVARILSPAEGDVVDGRVTVWGNVTDADGDAAWHVAVQLDDGPEQRVDASTGGWSAVVDLTGATPRHARPARPRDGRRRRGPRARGPRPRPRPQRVAQRHHRDAEARRHGGRGRVRHGHRVRPGRGRRGGGRVRERGRRRVGPGDGHHVVVRAPRPLRVRGRHARPHRVRVGRRQPRRAQRPRPPGPAWRRGPRHRARRRRRRAAAHRDGLRQRAQRRERAAPRPRHGAQPRHAGRAARHAGAGRARRGERPRRELRVRGRRAGPHHPRGRLPPRDAGVGHDRDGGRRAPHGERVRARPRAGLVEQRGDHRVVGPRRRGEPGLHAVRRGEPSSSGSAQRAAWTCAPSPAASPSAAPRAARPA